MNRKSVTGNAVTVCRPVRVVG